MNRRKLLASLPAVVAGGLLAARGVSASAPQADSIPQSAPPSPKWAYGWDLDWRSEAVVRRTWTALLDQLQVYWENRGTPDRMEFHVQQQCFGAFSNFWGPRYSGHHWWTDEKGREYPRRDRDGDFYVDTDFGQIKVFERANDLSQPDCWLVVS